MSLRPHTTVQSLSGTGSLRVGAAFIAYIAFYVKLHEGHDKKASTMRAEDRTKRAEEAVELSLEMQRAFIGLIGTHRRRTYAHDFVYGLHQLYSTFAKPWNATTEGSEHAHQEMKKYFHHLCCHNAKSKHGSVYQVLRLRHVKLQLMGDYARMYLPWSEYAAMRCSQQLGQESSAAAQRKAKRQRKEVATVRGLKKYKADSAMTDNADSIRLNIVL